MALSVNSSGQVYYQGKHWNIDDPLKPIGLTDLIRERALKMKEMMMKSLPYGKL